MVICVSGIGYLVKKVVLFMVKNTSFTSFKVIQISITERFIKDKVVEYVGEKHGRKI